MSEEQSEPRIGAGHASAMARLGLAELRAAAVFSESHIVEPSPYGIYRTKTPGEVQEERQRDSKDAGDYPPSLLNQQRMEPDQDRGDDHEDRDPREPDRE